MSESSGIGPIEVSDYVLATLASRASGASIAELLKTVKEVLSGPRIDAAVTAMIAAEQVEKSGKRLRLTPAGRQAADRSFGKLPPKAGDYIRRVVLPALALGLRPDGTAGRRLAKADVLRAAFLVRIYRLPLDIEKVTLGHAVASLLQRGLAGQSAPARESRLGGVAGNIGSLSEPDQLRKAILVLGLGHAAQPVSAPPPPLPAAGDLGPFSRQVLAVVAKTTTPPFPHKTAIAQVYDAYGRQYADAGSLHSFQQRLLQARKAGLLRLLPLDQPDALPPDVLKRSQVETPDGPVAFIHREDAE